MNEEKSIQDKINTYSEENRTDIILYIGTICKPYDDFIINECRRKKLHENVLLILKTVGGDPNAAYRIARCLQEAYQSRNNNNLLNNTDNSNSQKGCFKIFIDSLCKSAGTLICLGADELIISGNGELGPIDIQLNKKDEVGGMESGLTPIQALRSLQAESLILFQNHFTNLRFGNMRFSTKIAAEIASDLTKGLLSPIYGQIDPVRVAEFGRSMGIAKEYGDRLKSTNVKDNTIDKLMVQYPSHEFVIDRKEAQSLFNIVTNPTKELREIGNDLNNLPASSTPPNSPIVGFFSSKKTEEQT